MNSPTKTSPEFSEEYYRTGNYTDYLERGPRYHQIAIELDQLFQTLNLCRKSQAILDYGCGVGFLGEGLIKLGYENVYGHDASSWAVGESMTRGLNFDETVVPQIMVSLDVFEHMNDLDIANAIQKYFPVAIVARMPIARNGEQSFALEVSRKDKTHINCKTRTQWEQFFRNLGFSVVLRLNMRTIFDSEGVACLLALHP